MFFYLGNDCKLLDKHNANLHLDLGWKKYDNIFFKGYCLDYHLESNIDRIIQGDKPQGIYCVIQDTQIFHPFIRPFPLYSDNINVSNLKLDNFVEIENNKYSLPKTVKTFDSVVYDITKIIAENLSKVKLNIWCTGGIDSMMLVAIAEYAKLQYTIHIAKPRNVFLNIKNYEGTVEEYQSELLKFCRINYWAYSFLSNFKDKTITTGFYGDEYFCRSIWQIHLLANSINKLGTDIVKPSDYMYEHITKPKYKHLNNINTDINLDNVKFTTIRTLGTNQVWHLDNTITFCPLMDSRIVDNVWSLDTKTLLDCAADAILQKQIIETTTPSISLLVDTHKNSSFGRKNFFENIEKVKLPNCTNIIVH